MTTPFIIVTQHYDSKRWQHDSTLMDEQHVARAQASLDKRLRSSHPIAEILKVDPPVDNDVEIVQPKNGGEFYSIRGRTFEIISRHQTKPWTN